MPVIIFDTETGDRLRNDSNYMDERQPDVLQLAALLRDDNGTEMGSLNLLLQSERDIQPGAQAVHGISREVLDLYGTNPVNTLYTFRDMMTCAEIIVAHNIEFDAKIIDTAFYRAGLPPIPWEKLTKRDTMLASTNIVRVPHKNGRPGWKWPTLTETHMHFFGEGFDGAHDALADVRACARIYDELVKMNAFPAIQPKEKTNA